MWVLDELIKNQTLVRTEFFDEDRRDFTGIIVDYNIDTFYFEEKDEPIFITVNINPLDDILEDEVLHEDFVDIPLNCIRLA